MQSLHQTSQRLLGAKCWSWMSKKWLVHLFIKGSSGNHIGKDLKLSVFLFRIEEIVQGFELRSNYGTAKPISDNVIKKQPHTYQKCSFYF